MDKSLNIIGGGMAGCEAAWQAANMGIDVTLFEMRPKVKTFAHQTEKLGEMVCSNSFRSNDHEQNAVGLLHWEMMLANGLIINTAYQNKLPAYAWAENMQNEEAMERLKHHGADPQYVEQVIVPEHIPKVKDFYDSEQGQKHPKPSEEFLAYQAEQDAQVQDATDDALVI